MPSHEATMKFPRSIRRSNDKIPVPTITYQTFPMRSRPNAKSRTMEFPRKYQSPSNSSPCSQFIGTDLPEGIPNDPIALTPQRPAQRIPESAAKNQIGTLNRAQQAYYLENNQFTVEMSALGVGTLKDTPDYKYRSFVAPNRHPAVMNVGLSQRDNLRTFIGFVNLATTTTGEATTLGTLCISAKPAAKLPLWITIDYQPKNPTDPIACPSGFTLIK
jgi:hypothetical protein